MKTVNEKRWLLLLVGILLLVPMVSGSATITPVCTAPGIQRGPDISGDMIVWTDFRNDPTKPDIYMWDPINGEQAVCTDPGDQYCPTISGDTIFWVDYWPNGLYELYRWDPVDGVQKVCTVAQPTDAWWMDMTANYVPAISGSNVVWNDRYKDVCMWDPVYGQQLITMDAAIQYAPAISGTTIVWSDDRFGSEDIFKWDPAHGEQPVCVQNGYQWYPAISGDTIVWTDERTTTGSDIYMWDPVHGEQAICLAPGSQQSPDISGSIVVWEDNRNENITGWDIYMWDPINGEQPVCIDPGDQSDPAIWGDTIVWEDCRGEDADIYRAVIEFPDSPPTTGALTLISLPPGASISVDDEYKGRTPLVIHSVEPGDHTLVFSHPDHPSYPFTANVAPGENQTFSVNFTWQMNPPETTETPVPTTAAPGFIWASAVGAVILLLCLQRGFEK